MNITYIKIKNWRNFKNAEMYLARTSYLIGPNASGKSNLLDVFRFLRDIAKPDGGGLQNAIRKRGGLSKLRCLHHRRDSEVKLEIHLAENIEAETPDWKYILGFKSEGKGAQRILITTEQVWQGEKNLLNRIDSEESDKPSLTETYLEQTLANRNFRVIAELFSEVTYLHLVPQLLKYNDQIGGNRLEDDPFGQGFLERVAKSPKRTRDARLKKISTALSIAIPHFKELKFSQDTMGHPHLEALYEHHRPNAGWQTEDQFSDGTLRLLAMLWALQDGNGLLLMEEPELSLNQGIIEQIPFMIDRVQRGKKVRRQIIISTHSEALLNNPAIDHSGVSILTSYAEGTEIRQVDNKESAALNSGFSLAEVVLPQTRPQNIDQLGFWE